MRSSAEEERQRKFLATLAHEFRNILGPIANSVELLKRSELNEESRHAVDVIERQSARLLAVVEDLRKINPKD